MSESIFCIDINADAGESFGHYVIGNDEQLMPYLSSVNIACGFHAGDPVVMHKTVELAIKHQVAIGAHPGYPDLLGFGRRNMQVSPEEVREWVLYQVGALAGIVWGMGATLHHVKPHGALYNQAAVDYPLAQAIARAVKDFDPDLCLYGLAGSYLIQAARELGLNVKEEAFANRAYLNDGQLAPRTMKGSVFHDLTDVGDRVVEMILRGKVRTTEGQVIPITAQTLCLHGDEGEAVEMVRYIRQVLFLAGIQVTATPINKGKNS